MTLHAPSLPIWAPHVRRAAQQIDARFPRRDWTSTYGGHGEIYPAKRESNRGQYAVDFMVSSRALGDKIAEYVWAHRNELGVRYLIWWGRIRSETSGGGKWYRYFAADDPNPSKSHKNHVHVSFYSDARDTSTPPGTVPAAPSGRTPSPMADGENVYERVKRGQILQPGDNELVLDGKDSRTLVIGPSEGVDLRATVRTSLDGRPVPGTEVFFRVVSFKDGTKTTTVSDRLGVRGGDLAVFAGTISKLADGRSPRLRIVVRIPEGVTGAVVEEFEVQGFKL